MVYTIINVNREGAKKRRSSKTIYFSRLAMITDIGVTLRGKSKKTSEEVFWAHAVLSVHPDELKSFLFELVV